jgi:two-component system OmpR family sensor kinase
MAEVEMITSRSFEVDPQPCDFTAMVERVRSLLFVDETAIQIQTTCQKVRADCDLLTIVLKNLADNALKYGDHPPVRIACEAGRIIVSNPGPPLEKPFEALIEPFCKGDGGLTRQSFGLGLYIVQAILQAHGAALRHAYRNGEHHFIIEGIATR